jgi:hypothetical protein
MAATTPTEEKKEVYLEADKEIPGQHYCCLSFISPNKVLADKNLYFISEFLKDYEIQYRIKATETFLMAQAAKLQETLSKAQDRLENLIMKGAASTGEDLSGAVADIKATRASITTDVAADLEAHVKANMSDFTYSKIQDAYETFLFKNRKKMEEQFFEKNEFRTTVQGLKVRGTYDTYGEAAARAKTLQKLDPSHNVYVGQVGFWLPWDPEPADIGDVEYADDQLNTLMKKYKENETKRDELYAEQKISRMGSKGTPAAGAGPKGITAGSGGIGAAGGAATSSAVPTGMFGDEDLAIKRKKEAAAEAPSNVITHA